LEIEALIMTETLTTAERIARLNDQLRQGDTKIGEIRITQNAVERILIFKHELTLPIGLAP
jgi:hypothetical protein